MARIRSIHPGFFTDERIVSTSLGARLLFLGVGVEADDKGVFEWKPLTLKMRIFPADNVDVAACLSELEAADVIKKYEIEGREYGAIRNFRKHQRPKTPNDVHPITDEIGEYIGLTPSTSEKPSADAKAFPPKGEKSPQMEDGGWRMEDGRGKRKKVEDAAGAASPSSSKYAFQAKNIRLVAKDLDEWRKAYPALRLEAELFALDEWAGTKGKSWFNAVSSALKNKQIEADERAAERRERIQMEATRPTTRQHIDGRI